MERQEKMINALGLSERLRQSTEALHLQAERSGYIRKILRKQASREGYGLFLRSLEPAYAALEQALVKQGRHDDLLRFDWVALARHTTILGDLSALANNDWLTAFALLPEAEGYAKRITHIQEEAPHRLLGHAYVRYIGDLSGGQIVKAVLGQAPGLSAGMLKFYDFDGIDDADTFKASFREGLDRVGENTTKSDDIIDEALIAFQHNIDLSLAVDAQMTSG